MGETVETVSAKLDVPVIPRLKPGENEKKASA